MGQADRTPLADVVALDEERQKRSPDTDPNLTTAGGMLRAAREAMGLTVETVAEQTNIKLSHLEAIEAMDIEALPSQPYTMGFVRAFAREVALPEDALMARFRQQAGYAQRDRAPGVASPIGSKPADGGRELSAVALLAIIGFVVWCLWKILGSAAPETAADPGRFAFSAEDQDREVIFIVPADPAEAATTAEAATEEAISDAPDDAVALAAEAPNAEALPATTGEDAAEASSAEPTPDVEGDLLTRLVTVEPVYPPLCEAEAAPVEAVSLVFNISGRGRVIGPRISESSNPCFNGAAIAAVSRWRYDPATITAENSRGLSTRFVFDRPY